MTLVIMFSDLRLGDLNYLESVKPTPQRQGCAKHKRYFK